MATSKRLSANVLAIIALIVTITLVSVILAKATDLPSLLRSVIAIASGVVAAALTTAAVSKRR